MGPGLEIALLFGGMWMYFRTGAGRRTAMMVFGAIMVGIQSFVFFGPPPASEKAAAATALLAYFVFALVIAMLERRRIRAPIIALAILTGCAPTGASVKPAVDAPTHFLVRAPDGRVVEPTPGEGCRNPMIDPRDGAALILIRSAGGRGDYQVPVARYGVRRGELLRIECGTGLVVGIVKR